MVALWEKLLFWKKPKRPKLDADYEFFYIDESDYTAIRLLNNEYAGVTYYYGTVSLQEIQDTLSVKFEYRIIDSGKYTEESLNSDSNFVKIIGDILTEILIEEEAKHESDRKDDTEEFDIQ